MKIRKYKYIVLGLVAALGFTACDDFLEQVNPNQLTSDSFWKTKEDLQGGVYSIYNAFKNGNVSPIVEENLRSDLGWPGWGRPNTTNVYYLQTFTESSGAPNNKWDALYAGIFRANQVIYGAEGLVSSIDSAANPEEKVVMNDLLGQAYFFRGLFHFYLHNSFNNGSVIIRDALPETVDEFNKGLSPKEEVFDFFMKDLKYAKSLLLKKSDRAAGQLGMVTAEAAAAVIGKAYLYENNYDSAKVYFEEIIKDPNYSLVRNINDNWNEAGEHNSESILEVNYSLNYGSGLSLWSEEQSSSVNLNILLAPAGVPGGWRTLLPAPWLVMAYKNDSIDISNERNFKRDENGDVMYHKDVNGNDSVPMLRKYSLRSSYSIALPDDDDTEYYQLKPGQAAPFNNAEPAYFRKYTNCETHASEKDVDALIGRSGINRRLIRLADVYLMYAECLIKGGADESGVEEALIYVNRIRERSALLLLGGNGSGEFPSNNHDNVTYTAQSLMEHIMNNERPLELSIEGNAIRTVDLRRWGITKQRFQQLSTLEFGLDDLQVDDPKKPGEIINRWGAVLSLGPNSNGDVDDRMSIDFDAAAANYDPAIHAYWPIPNGESTANPSLTK